MPFGGGGGGGEVVSFVKEWNLGICVWSVGNVFADSLGILLKEGGIFIEEYVAIAPGRLLCVDVIWGGKKFRFIYVYAPCNITERFSFLKCLPVLLMMNRCVVLNGDFNCSLDDGVVGGRRDFSAAFLIDLLVKFNLVDVFKKCWVQ